MSLAGGLLFYAHPVRPDWAIFESFWQQTFSLKWPKYLETFWAFLKYVTYNKKLLWMLHGPVL